MHSGENFCGSLDSYFCRFFTTIGRAVRESKHHQKNESWKTRHQKIPKEILVDIASNVNRHQLDLYVSYGARSCANRELRVLTLDRHKNELHMMGINPIAVDLSWILYHPKNKMLRNFLVPYFSTPVFWC